MKVHAMLMLLLLPASLFSQDYDQRLLSSYDAVTLENLQQTNPDRLELLTYAVENALYFTETSASKGVELATIEVPETATSFTDLGLTITDHNQYFKVQGDDRILVVKSFWVLNNELEKK